MIFHEPASRGAHVRSRDLTAASDSSLRDKHVVLGLFEDGCPEAGLREHTRMFRLPVLHSSEAYFSRTQILLWERRG